MKRLMVLVILLACLAVPMGKPTEVQAQESGCPENTGAGGGYFIAGSYPDYLETCPVIIGGFTWQDMFVDTYNNYPCEEVIALRYHAWLHARGMLPGVLDTSEYSFYFAWPDDKISQEARVRLYVWFPEIVGAVSAPPPIDATWYVQYYWPNGIPISGQTGSVHDLVQYSFRVEHSWGGVAYTNLYMVDVTLPTVRVNGATADGGYFKFSVFNGSGEFPWDVEVASVQIDIADTDFPPMCLLPDGSYQISTVTPTPTGVWSTPTPGPPAGPTAPYSTPHSTRPAWPTPTTRPYVTLIPEPSSTWIPFPTLIPITFPTIHWPSVPTVAVTATPTPAGGPTSTPPPTIDSIATLNGNIGALATQWAEPIGLANTYLVSETLVLSDTTLTEGAGGLMETIALPFRLFKTAQIYSPSTWPFYAAILVSIAVVLGVQLIRFALMIFFFFFEVFRRLWEMLPLN